MGGMLIWWQDGKVSGKGGAVCKGGKGPQLEDLRPLAHLGSGAYGSVYYVEDVCTRKRYALKRVSKQVALRAARILVGEVRALREVQGCSFTAQLVKTYADSGSLYILQEALIGGELYLRIASAPDARLCEKAARFYLACAVTALSQLHSRDLVHGDIKPENLLLDSSGYLHVVDFGSARRFQGTPSSSGTLDYAAPECLLRQPLGPGVDSWALGCVLYFMLTGALPFSLHDQETEDVIADRILDADYHPQLDPAIPLSCEVKDLLKRLLMRNPARRLGGGKGGAAELKDHPWFEGFDWEGLESRRLPAPFIPAEPVLDVAAGVGPFDWSVQKDCIPAATMEEFAVQRILSRLDLIYSQPAMAPEVR